MLFHDKPPFFDPDYDVLKVWGKFIIARIGLNVNWKDVLWQGPSKIQENNMLPMPVRASGARLKQGIIS
jgi:hypothetical protein